MGGYQMGEGTLKQREIHVGQIRTQYLEAGTGPALLLLHGDAGTAFDWADILSELAPGHRVVALHLPGYGYTQTLPPTSGEQDDAEHIARFVWAFADAVGIGDTILGGHSFGGLTALHAALQQSGRVPAMIIVDGAGLGRAVGPLLYANANTPLGRLTAAANLMPGGAELLSLLLAPSLYRQPWRVSRAAWKHQVEASRSRVYLRMALSVARRNVGWLGQKYPVVDRLPELSMPVLLVWGLLDNVVPFWHGVRASRLLPAARLHLVPFAGHIPHVEASTEVLEVMRPFLGSVAEGSARCSS
ncbi:alpha/beta fold hydrolase [Streptomyces sp. Ac-502]|uniref:alpha/beta fold hydrolase n=1 Tax=Streptomyces sp. Ac-502 TaxID=3342801 RepID=UPI00386299F9